jgi:CRISPR/Cas system-associated exonuclease Cas4 (RecB family)
MTKSLLQQIMVKSAKSKNSLDVDAVIQKIESGYMVGQDPSRQTKKAFAPSVLVYGYGECPRYWYHAFDGVVFESTNTPFSVANMSNGSLSHNRIQDALLKSGIAKKFVKVDRETNKEKETTEFEVINSDPLIYGWADGMIEWNNEEFVIEIKTASNEGFEYIKKTNKAKSYHVAQLLIYMKILKMAKGLVIYENKNNHELFVIPIEVNDHYRQWIDTTFDWMRTVRQAWKDKQLPQKNYRANSKICKGCPIQKACALSEPGVIKIGSLEQLSEAM